MNITNRKLIIRIIPWMFERITQGGKDAKDGVNESKKIITEPTCK